MNTNQTLKQILVAETSSSELLPSISVSSFLVSALERFAFGSAFVEVFLFCSFPPKEKLIDKICFL